MARLENIFETCVVTFDSGLTGSGEGFGYISFGNITDGLTYSDKILQDVNGLTSSFSP